ncbi:MAG: tyrosine-type recombinase/integrase [Bryobacterales bacterium]|nr:tyrosine-type recombinase/integrase [Bryobacterales bacterium]
MTVRDAIERYVAWKRSSGARFQAGANALNHYACVVGSETDLDAVGEHEAAAFLTGSGPLTPTRSVKRSVLDGFYRYALGRELASRSPLPALEPPRPPSAPPYLYSRDEVGRLLEAAQAPLKRVRQLEPQTFRALLLLLYGAGLRLGEALQLTHADVDLTNLLLTVRKSKLGKTRLVPLDPTLGKALAAHAACTLPADPAGAAGHPFFANRDGTPLRQATVRGRFRVVREAAGIPLLEGARRQPCLHDLRHAAAQHRLVSWYRQGQDVQRLLPVLATYLGHVSLASTQLYLSMTPELLGAASARFARYAEPRGGCHA